MKTFVNSLSIIALSVLMLAGCRDYEPDVKVSDSGQVFSNGDILVSEGFTIFIEAVNHADLESEIFDADVTIFAPSNEAFNVLFNELGIDSVTEIATTELADLLKYHVVPEKVPVSNRATITSFTTLEGSSLFISINYAMDSSLSVNGYSSIVNANNYTESGIIHGISIVLEEPASDILSLITSDTDYSTLSGLLTRVGMNATLSDPATELTVFAPSNGAFTEAGLDATTLAGMSDQEVTDLLSFHMFSGRLYSVSVGVDGRIASELGTTADDNVQEVEFEDGLPNGAVLDSVNYSADNGVVHYAANIISQSSTNSGFIPTDFRALIAQVGANAMYDNLDTLYSFVALDAGAPAVGDFANDAEIQDWLDTYTFDGSLAFRDLESGTKVKSGNGSEFFLQHTATELFTFNGRNFFSTQSTDTYNGYRNRFFSGDRFVLGDDFFSSAYPTPLPEETITEVLAASSDYNLVSAAIVAAGMDDLVDAEGTTFYAVVNDTIASLFGLTLMEIEDLEEEDAIEMFETLILAHTVPNEVISSLLITEDQAIQESAADEIIVWGFVEDVLVIITDLQDAQNNFITGSVFDIWASNGVIHVIDDVIDM